MFCGIHPSFLRIFAENYTKKDVTYYEYTFTLTPASQDAGDLLSAFLAEAGFETFEDKGDGTLKAWIQQSLCDEAAVEAACGQLRELMDTGTAYSRDTPEHRDWNERWERESFRPILIDGRIHIHAPWQEALDVEHDIVIEPRMAFGTGSHATTNLLLHILAEQQLEGTSVIDAGCGTGVLGMLCLMRGAVKLTAYDIDHWSVENTRRNLGLNHLEAEVMEGDAGVLEGHGGHDIILANINRNILLQEVPRMMASLNGGGLLIVSGFYTDDAPILAEAFGVIGLTVERQEEKDGWCAIIFRKTLGA